MENGYQIEERRPKKILKPLAAVGFTLLLALSMLIGLAWPGGITEAKADLDLSHDWYYDANGFNPHRDYFNQKPNEIIDPFTGNVSWAYTDVYLPGKGGFDLKINRVYTNKVLWGLDGSFPCFPPYHHAGLGWKMHMGVLWDPMAPDISGTDEGNMYIEMPDGSEHMLYDPTSTYSEYQYITKDFWKVEWSISEGGYILYLKDGTRYYFTHRVAHYGGVNHISDGYWCTKIEDPHGNRITVNYATDSPFTRITSIVDSYGRNITFNYTEKPGAEHLLTSIRGNGKTLFSYEYALGTPVDPWQGAPYVMTRAEPPAGPDWEYTYYTSRGTDGWPNELKTVEYPTGAAITYKYEDGTVYNYNSGTHRIRQVKSRSTSNPSEGTTTYSYSRSSATNKTTVYHPSSLKEEYDFYGYKAASNGNVWKIGLLQEKRTYWGTSLMQKETYSHGKKTIGTERCGTFPETGYDNDAYAPIETRYTITRGTRSYENEYLNHDEYGNPRRLEEDGELSRTTDLTYYYKTSYGDFIVDRVKKEVISAGGSSRTIDRTFNSDGDMTSEDRYGVYTTYTYDGYGNLTRVTDDNGNYINYSNYSYGMPKTISRDGISYFYRDVHWSGTLSKESDGRGNYTYFGYDNLNRVTSIDLPGSETTITISYGTAYRKATQGSFYFQVNMDGFGRMDSTQDSAGIKTDINYDNRGLVSYRSYNYTSSNIGDSFDYDGLGRLSKITHNDGSSITYNNNSSGHYVTVTNERGKSSTTYLESYGDPDDTQIQRVADPIAGTTYYDFDILGNLTKINPYQGGDHVFNYNTQGFMTSESHPETGSITYTHDEVGNIKSRTWSGQATTYTYDGLNRLKTISYTGQSEYNVSFAYDGADNRTQMKDSSGNFTYTYDYTYNSNNRLTQVKAAIEGKTYYIGYGYDSRGNMSKVDYPGSDRDVNYSYDSGNRVTGVSAIVGGSSKTLASGVSHHPSGGVSSATLGNSVSLTKGYHSSRYWITSVNYKRYTTKFLDLGLSHDNVGNVTGITDGMSSSYNISMGYDDLDRLTSASGKWGGGSFTYDRLGNRKSKSLGGSTTSYTYSGTTNRLTSASGAEAASFSYDNRGNIIEMDYSGTENDLDLTYDTENRLNSANSRFYYYYNADGNMIMKSDNQGSTYFYLYDMQGNMLVEMEEGNPLQKDHVYLDGEPLALVVGEPDPDSPHVDSISPDSAPNTGSISATVSGSNFQTGAQVSLRKTGEPVIEATGEAVTATSITCTLNLTGVAPGGWDVVVRNPDGREDALTDGFNVINPGDFTVTSITPNRGKVGTVVNITNLAGAGFQAGATVRLELGGTVIDATDVNVLSGTLITCKFNLAGAPLGFYDVVVQNPDGMEVRLTRGFEVYECGPAAGMAALMLGLMMGLLAMADNRRRGRVKSWLKRRARLLTSITIILAMSALLAFAPSLGGVERFAGSTTAEAAAIENVYYYHNDHLGTPMAMTDADRNVVWRANYRPFGESQDQSGDLDNTQRFTGKRYDEDIGLYCFGTRHYDPKTARFTSTDPIFHKDNSLQFMNFYSYVVNNPYRMIDPSGNMPTWSQVTKSIDAFANRVSKMHPMAQFAVGMGVVIGLTIGTVAVCVGGAYVVGIAAGAVTVGGIGVAEFTALTHGTAQIADVLCLSLNGTTIASAFTGAELTVGTLATAWGVSEATATLAVFLAGAALLGYSIKDACEKFGITNEQLEEAKKALKDLKGKSPTSEDKSAETDKTTKEVKKAPSGTAPPVKGENKKK